MKIRTYTVAPIPCYWEIGYSDALAAASAINKLLGDAGTASWIDGDDAGRDSALAAVMREIESCAPEIAADLEFVVTDIEGDDDDR